MTTKNSREDVVRAAGRLFARHGYHGTSMRDLGRELGLLGSSLYAHVGGKQELLVEVVKRGARLFEDAATEALDTGIDSEQRLAALISGHVRVVLENRDVVRTFLNEASALDLSHRKTVLAARDHYERHFRKVLHAGVIDGSFRSDLDPKVTAIFILSLLNTIDRWYDNQGSLSPQGLVSSIGRFVGVGINRAVVSADL